MWSTVSGGLSHDAADFQPGQAACYKANRTILISSPGVSECGGLSLGSPDPASPTNESSFGFIFADLQHFEED